MRSVSMFFAVTAAFAVLPLFAGCGGGASTEPDITIKPSKSGGSGEGGDDSSDDTKKVAEGFGTFTGRVVFEGNPPQLSALVAQGAADKDPEVCAAESAIPNQRLLVGSDGGVKNVFIYLTRKPAGAKESPVPEEPAVFDQEFCIFKPHAFLPRVGQTVEVLSDDPIAHNTHTFPQRNQGFNQVIKADDRSGAASFTYKRPETAPIEVKCDFHNWMIAYHLPLDHPFAAVTKEDGSFEIPDLPAGTHEFRIWHEGAAGKFLDRAYKVTIQADDVTEKEIAYPEGKFIAARQPGGKSVKLSSLVNQ